MENNKNIKVIARQIAPEYQESPFEYCDKSYYYGIIIRGNRDFVEFYGEETDDFVTVEETLKDGYACDFLISVENGDKVAALYDSNEKNRYNLRLPLLSARDGKQGRKNSVR